MGTVTSRAAYGSSLFPELVKENSAYLTNQLITYIGNKRALLRFINDGVAIAKSKLGKNYLDVIDLFSGSGIVSRYFKMHSNLLVVNDLEKYAEVINRCYLTNYEDVDSNLLEAIGRELQSHLTEDKLQEGTISRNYAPRDDANIREGERVFYTRRNACYIDTARTLIDTVETEYQRFFLAPLLAEASIHANTSGVFKGFYKCKETGLGKFGGASGDALSRITGNIQLQLPVFSNFNSETMIFCGDANKVAETVPEVDLAYLDPPYNQHPYGSNYFMLNLIVDNTEPDSISTVSGIPRNWNRSPYNKKAQAYSAFKDLVEKLNAKFVLISFNSDGFISTAEMLQLCKKVGKVIVLETKYNTFRGSRNLRNRDIHVKEYLYLVEKH
jgi:adenine-specific DNA-methyltransferase